MTRFTDYLDLVDNLDRTVRTLRENAARAANNGEDDSLCCWQVQKIGGQDQVVQVRVDQTQLTDLRVIAVPAEGGVADHIAGMHPRAVLALARLLDHQVQRLRRTPVIKLGEMKLDQDLKLLVEALNVDLHD